MFHNNNENTIDVEVRSEREADKCYFKAKDISSGFGIKDLLRTLIHKDRGKIIVIMYILFAVMWTMSTKNK